MRCPGTADASQVWVKRARASVGSVFSERSFSHMCLLASTASACGLLRGFLSGGASSTAAFFSATRCRFFWARACTAGSVLITSFLGFRGFLLAPAESSGAAGARFSLLPKRLLSAASGRPSGLSLSLALRFADANFLRSARLLGDLGVKPLPVAGVTGLRMFRGCALGLPVGRTGREDPAPHNPGLGVKSTLRLRRRRSVKKSAKQKPTRENSAISSKRCEIFVTEPF